MTEIEYALNRICVLEDALSSLVGYELSTLAPYSSEKWDKLNSIYDKAKRDLLAIDLAYNSNKEQK